MSHIVHEASASDLAAIRAATFRTLLALRRAELAADQAQAAEAAARRRRALERREGV